MAKKSSVEKQRRRQEMVDSAWEKRSNLRKVAKSAKSTEAEKEEARLALNKMPRNTSPIRLRNRCQLTGRSRGYLRKFGLSRLCFREMASMGLIPGVVKASW